jgi:hypothetical protein
MVAPEEKTIQMNDFSEMQVNLAKNICDYLEICMDQHITLAERFKVSTTLI